MYLNLFYFMDIFYLLLYFLFYSFSFWWEGRGGVNYSISFLEKGHRFIYSYFGLEFLLFYSHIQTST